MSLTGYSGTLGGVPVAPGVGSFISLRSPTSRQYLSGDRCVISTTFTAASPGAGKGKPLSANTLDHDAPGLPFVDSAELYILEVVVPLDMLNNPH